ncbi:MAG: alpha-ketoacid dehydrogenase subunit beta [Anaerolineales bacterium]|jgi:pyruvate dehydrogenase E1 component beta subunit
MSGRRLTMVEALREALSEEMRRDASVFLMGEDLQIGGGFQVTLGLVDEFGPERVRNTPLAETGFTGAAIGAALVGMRPVIEYQYGDFIFCAMDQLVNEAAKLRYMSGGQVSVPIVVRVPTGASGRAAQHAQSLEGHFLHVPGLKLVLPATPYDAKGLLIASLRDNNPVLFFEHKLLYGTQGRDTAESPLLHTEVPEGSYTVDLGRAHVVREGGDVSIVATLLMVHRSLEAAEGLAADGIEAEVIDLRTLVPLDVATILRSVEKTGRLVVAEEGPRTGGWGAEVAARVASEGVGYLNAPIERVAGPDVPVPFSPPLEAAVVPSAEQICNAVLQLMQPGQRKGATR